MAGATLRSTGDRIQNDNYLKVGVVGAYNLPLVEWTREVVTDTPYPGNIGMPPTSTGGEDKRQLCDDKDDRADCVFEIDFGQVATCATAYTAADEVPILQLRMNRGMFCRNIYCIDPAGNVDAETALCTSSGTQGYLKVVTEPTLTQSNPYGFGGGTVGTNSSSGQFILISQRVLGVQLYYLSDPNANYQDVVNFM